MIDDKYLDVMVTLRRVSDGLERTFSDDSVWLDDDGIPSCYQWTDGNYGCDCNREIFFERAAGVEVLDEGNPPCTHGRYLARIVDGSGNVLLDEIDPDGHSDRQFDAAIDRLLK